MKGLRKTLVGRVVSDKMDKTVVVAVETRRPHPLYKKVVKHRTILKAHDADNACNMGDVVRLEETRPISRDKRWRVIQIVTKGDVAEVQPKDVDVQVSTPEPSQP